MVKVVSCHVPITIHFRDPVKKDKQTNVKVVSINKRSHTPFSEARNKTIFFYIYIFFYGESGTLHMHHQQSHSTQDSRRLARRPNEERKRCVTSANQLIMYYIDLPEPTSQKYILSCLCMLATHLAFTLLPGSMGI